MSLDFKPGAGNGELRNYLGRALLHDLIHVGSFKNYMRYSVYPKVPPLTKAKDFTNMAIKRWCWATGVTCSNSLFKPRTYVRDDPDEETFVKLPIALKAGFRDLPLDMKSKERMKALKNPGKKRGRKTDEERRMIEEEKKKMEAKQ